MTLRLGFSVALLALALAATGCGECSVPADSSAATATNGHDHEHEHGEAPASFGEAVEKLVAMRNQVRDAFAAKDIDAAHGPLHEVGHLLEAVPALAAKLSPAPDAAAVKSAAEKLFDLFGQIDGKLHDSEEVSYSEFSTEIDAAVATLQGLLPSAASAPASEEGK